MDEMGYFYETRSIAGKLRVSGFFLPDYHGNFFSFGAKISSFPQQTTRRTPPEGRAFGETHFKL